MTSADRSTGLPSVQARRFRPDIEITSPHMDPTAIVAIVVSIVAALHSWRTSRRQQQLHTTQTDLQARQTDLQARQTEQQERLVELETARERDRLMDARRAYVVASIDREKRQFPTHRSPTTGYFLRLSNEGKAAARDIRLLLDGGPIHQHSLIPRNEEEFTTLGPGASNRYHLLVMLGSHRIIHVELTWTDESGEPGRWTSQLTL